MEEPVAGKADEDTPALAPTSNATPKRICPSANGINTTTLPPIAEADTLPYASPLEFTPAPAFTVPSGRDQVVVLVVFIRRRVAKGIGDLGVVAHSVIGIVCGIALSILGRSGAAHRIIAGGAATAF